MDKMDEALYWMWLAGALPAAFAHMKELLDGWGNDPAALYRALREGGPVPAGVSKAAAQKLLHTDPADYAPRLEQCAAKGIAILTPANDAYPQRLRELPDLPAVLYATGDTACLNGRRYVSMVGTRRPTQYGKQACRDISLELARRGVVLVSGLADGLDGESHQAAVEVGQATVAFLGTPIDVTYPAANGRLREQIEQKGGCVLSEYAPDFNKKPRATFLARNRLIAALGEALCVAEARVRSGTLNTVSHALRYGRPVLAIPGNIYSPTSAGANALLREGKATMLCDADDVAARIAPGLPKGDPAPRLPKDGPGDEGPGRQHILGEDADAVLAVLDQTPRPVDEVVRRCALPVNRVLAALLELEMYGAAQSEPGQRYRAV